MALKTTLKFRKKLFKKADTADLRDKLKAADPYSIAKGRHGKDEATDEHLISEAVYDEVVAHRETGQYLYDEAMLPYTAPLALSIEDLRDDVDNLHNHVLNEVVGDKGDKGDNPYRVTNLLDSVADWSIGTGSTTGFSANGAANENIREIDETPFGGRDVIWKATNMSTDNAADGGFNSGVKTIDSSKRYRFSLFFKAESDNGSKYLGTTGSGTNLLNMSGSANGNPYFWSGDFDVENEWYLVVGYVHQHDVGTTSPFNGGIYKVSTGEKVRSATSFKWHANTTGTNIRAYQYYNPTSEANEVWMWKPRIDICEGDEPSIQELLRKGMKGDTGSTGPQGPKGNAGSAGADGTDGAKGDKGDTGAAGSNGTNGAKGDKGDKGDTGSAGSNGSDGAKGTKGDTGLTGPQGPKGNAGSAGADGTDGAKGDKGDTGLTGPQGPKGTAGSAGTNGTNGATGATGPQGPTGPKGNTGSTGPQGPKGNTGATGNSHLSGINEISIDRKTGDMIIVTGGETYVYSRKAGK